MGQLVKVLDTKGTHMVNIRTEGLLCPRVNTHCVPPPPQNKQEFQSGG